MVRHIVLFSFKDGFTEQEKAEHLQNIKLGLVRLTGIIDGVVSINVIIDPLSTSNTDFLLDSTFESEAALAAYQIHPEHKKISHYIGDVREVRSCFDYYC
ncbi:MAG: Dabb family protein [Oscillospiraceae bacterium]|jgi:hypothetical protein|nr:Dabb family protein [Oscillospiraceae bacterium]